MEIPVKRRESVETQIELGTPARASEAASRSRS
jgi:hypothetical protein